MSLDLSKHHGREHDKLCLSSSCHMVFSSCSKPTHPRLLRLASESCIFGRMRVCAVRGRGARGKKKKQKTSYLTGKLVCQPDRLEATSRGAHREIALTCGSFKRAIEFFTRRANSGPWRFCFLLLQSWVEERPLSGLLCVPGYWI